MSVLPDTKLEQIQFCENHVAVWLLAPTTIGLTAGQVNSLDVATKNARDAYILSQATRDAAKASTTAYAGKTGLMRDMAADLIRVIKSYAELQSDPSAVYAAAQVPMPAEPVPATPPGKPQNISVTLEPSGAVTVSWDAENAAASTGGFFNVSRKLPGQSGFAYLTGTPGSTTQSRRMSFTDFAVPTSAAAAGVQYIMQGRRGNLEGGASDAITVQFGVDGGGLTVTGASGEMLKMAA